MYDLIGVRDSRNLNRRAFLGVAAAGAAAGLMPGGGLAASTLPKPTLPKPTLAKPAGEVLLEVGGAIENTNRPGRAAFDDAMLLALPQVSFRTSTIWTKGEKTFSGPALSSVLDAVGAGPGKISAGAANDYRVTLSRDLIEPQVPIIANRIDGKPFSLRERGPLWVIFPYDRAVRYRTETIYEMSIWQLTTLTVRQA